MIDRLKYKIEENYIIKGWVSKNGVNLQSLLFFNITGKRSERFDVVHFFVEDHFLIEVADLKNLTFIVTQQN